MWSCDFFLKAVDVMDYITDFWLVSQLCIPINVYSGFIHNCPNLKATKISFSRWMDKWSTVHLGNGILLSAFKKKKGQALSSYEKTWRNLKRIFLNKRSQSAMTTWFWKRQKDQGLGVGREESKVILPTAWESVSLTPFHFWKINQSNLSY